MTVPRDSASFSRGIPVPSRYRKRAVPRRIPGLVLPALCAFFFASCAVPAWNLGELGPRDLKEFAGTGNGVVLLADRQSDPAFFDRIMTGLGGLFPLPDALKDPRVRDHVRQAFLEQNRDTGVWEGLVSLDVGNFLLGPALESGGFRPVALDAPGGVRAWKSGGVVAALAAEGLLAFRSADDRDVSAILPFLARVRNFASRGPSGPMASDPVLLRLTDPSIILPGLGKTVMDMDVRPGRLTDSFRLRLALAPGNTGDLTRARKVVRLWLWGMANVQGLPASFLEAVEFRDLDGVLEVSGMVLSGTETAGFLANLAQVRP